MTTAPGPGPAGSRLGFWGCGAAPGNLPTPPALRHSGGPSGLIVSFTRCTKRRKLTSCSCASSSLCTRGAVREEGGTVSPGVRRSPGWNEAGGMVGGEEEGGRDAHPRLPLFTRQIMSRILCVLMSDCSPAEAQKRSICVCDNLLPASQPPAPSIDPPPFTLPRACAPGHGRT